MDPKNLDPPSASTCTTCTYAEDFSNYWTASLYFRSPENGTYKMVPQRPNFEGLDGIRHPDGGGITIYYMTPFGGGNQKVTAFPPVSSDFFGVLFNVSSLSKKGAKEKKNRRKLSDKSEKKTRE